MKPPAFVCLLVVSIAAALVVAGCGGSGSSSGPGGSGGGSSSSSGGSSGGASSGPGGRAGNGGSSSSGGSGVSSSSGGNGGSAGAGAPKKATAPNAPAGSKVLACGGSGAGVSGLRAVATDCGTARVTMARWERAQACALAAGAARSSCALGAYRCQAIVAGQGTVVSCARPDGSDISFVARSRR